MNPSINSFGFGGANAHCIIESYEPKSAAVTPIANGHQMNGIHKNGTRTNGAITNGSTHGTNGVVANASIPKSTTLIPFVFSATSVKSLVSLLDSLREFLERNPEVSLPSLAYTLSTRRSALSLRDSIYASSADQLRKRIEEKLGTDVAETSTSHSVAALSTQPSVLGIFTGQGAQWPAMGLKLFTAIPMVKEILSSLDESLASLPAHHRPSWTLAEAISPDSKQNMSEAAVSQPLCTAVQIVLFDLLRAAGVRFRAVVGHSSGEIAAAYAAGFLSAPDAIRIACYRGYFAKLAAGPGGEDGGMIAAGTAFEDASELCQVEDLVGRLSVAAHNSQTSVTLSGDISAVELAKDVFEEEQKFARVLRVDTAYHSVHMRRCSGLYLKALRELKIEPLQPDENAPQCKCRKRTLFLLHGVF